MGSGAATSPHSGEPGPANTDVRVERMLVPGATMSGLMRLSDVGPREEKQAMPSGLSDTWPAAAMVGNNSGPPPADGGVRLGAIPGVGVDPCGRLFSVAPTVRQFFAVAGVPT